MITLLPKLKKMGRVLKLSLTVEQQSELEKSYRKDKSHAFRQRCRMVLLKNEGLKTSEICKIVGIGSQHQVNGWIKKYAAGYATSGINILHNQAGQGRKSTFKAIDRHRLEQIVKSERQKLSNAKVILEKEMSKTFHVRTLTNFLKALTADIND